MLRKLQLELKTVANTCKHTQLKNLSRVCIPSSRTSTTQFFKFTYCEFLLFICNTNNYIHACQESLLMLKILCVNRYSLICTKYMSTSCLMFQMQSNWKVKLYVSTRHFITVNSKAIRFLLRKKVATGRWLVQSLIFSDCTLAASTICGSSCGFFFFAISLLTSGLQPEL